MGFKDLFFVSDGDDKKQETGKDVQQTFKNKFPTSGPIETPKKTETKAETVTATQTVTEITPDNPACAPHLDKIMKLYEDGFDGLDMDGYDFYEYFQMVVEAGINNAAAYNMAFTMGKTMGATKESLVEQAQFYIDEINKVHQIYVDNGTVKKESALKAKGEDEATLTKELTNINDEIARLTALKTQKESALSSIDAKYSPQITEIECKLMANDIARERILGTINTVVNGIKSNI
jgi:hypothetical protein